MWLLSGVVALALIASACGSDDSAAGISVSGAWARESPAMADAGAAYMTITSDVDDQLVGVSVDSAVAGRSEIHEVVAADAMEGEESTDMSDDTMEQPMVMQQVEALTLPAGEAVVLEPGGYHIMLLELAAPLVQGESFDLTLDFAEAGPMTLSIDVRSEAP